MLKLKLQYFGHLIQTAGSFEKTLMLGKAEGENRRGWQRMRWLDGITGHGVGWTLGVGDGQGGLVCCGSWGRKESDTTEWLNWSENLRLFPIPFPYTFFSFHVLMTYSLLCLHAKLIQSCLTLCTSKANSAQKIEQSSIRTVFPLTSMVGRHYDN